ncbi:maleylpyruvate isomerase family mycothiol-dependent enzyme [Actinomadura scrupuli]|uniref:maleylpyruvate isomerase family mycothiol-dependent enzyme n=1 Tax=Actinomadura scrupuli TaxID=559629 RepID=UPI003D99E9EB
MRLPLEDELRAERYRLVETLEGLSDADFDAGTTLCARWTPRDVLGHLICSDYVLGSYLPYGGRINDANDAQAERVRGMSRPRLMEWARHWAYSPSPAGRLLAAPLLLGDLGIHHQDIVRGLGLTREVPRTVAGAILREGLQLSLWLNRRVLRHRIVPTDGGRSYGRGPEVLGTREALGLWLAGRDSVARELTFVA